MVTSANQRPGPPGGDQSEARAVARDASVAVDDVAPVAGAEGRAAIDLHISGPGLCSAGHSH